MLTKKARKDPHLARKRRVRKKVFGTADCPRLTVYRSNQHLYAQVVDDTRGHTLTAASTLCWEFKKRFPKTGKNKEAAKVVGEIVGDSALSKGISRLVFDRNGFLYHGRIKAMAEAVRQKGLVF